MLKYNICFVCGKYKDTFLSLQPMLMKCVLMETQVFVDVSTDRYYGQDCFCLTFCHHQLLCIRKTQ